MSLKKISMIISVFGTINKTTLRLKNNNFFFGVTVEKLNSFYILEKERQNI